GSPTLVSLAPALIEVQAGAGLSADPQDPPAFARAMTQLLEDEPSRLLWQAAGHARARALSWDLAAQRLAQVYQQVVRA
ncbi:MAG: hypothetical protein RJA77_1162, partial [Pseudomonadota bacterium]